MRLLRVRLKNYRGVSDCTVEFPANGVTVIEGDNEVGKTCIAEALDLILNELDSSHKQKVRAIRPVHRDAGPEVEVEINAGGYRFAYFKRWHRQPETTLEVTAPRREQLTGREAHERVEAIMEETLDRDLWNALTVEQGAEPGVPKLGVPSLGRALDLAASGDRPEGADDALWERICAERHRYWTGTGRESQERKALAEKVGHAQSEVENLQAQLLDIDKDAEEVARLARDEHGLAASRDQFSRDEEQLSRQLASAETIRAEVGRLEAARQVADAELGRMAEARRRRQELAGALDARREESDDLRKKAEQAGPSLDLANSRCEEAGIAMSAARDSLRAAEEELRAAEGDRDHHQKLIDKELLSERLERVLTAQEDLRTAESVLAASRVDNELVGQIEQASIKMTRAEAALSASAASVELSASAPFSVLINGEETKLSPGAAQYADVTDGWELVVPDAVRVKVRAGAGSRNLAAEFEAAKDDHGRLCAQGGVGDLAEARRKADERLDAERQRDDAAQTIDRDLRDLTPDVLAQKVDGLARGIATYPAGRPESRPLPDSLEDARRMALEARSAFEAQQAEIGRCEENEKEADKARQRSAIDAAALAGQLDRARDARQQAEQRLEEARKDQSDAALDEALAAQQGRAGAAAAALLTKKEELTAQDPDSLEARLDNARDAKVRAETDLRQNQDRRQELRGRLEARGEAGLHSRLDDAITEYQRLEREHQRIESRALAALMLHQTFEVRRQQARQRYIAPFKEQIEQLGRIVFGPTFEVELDGDLRVVQRTLEGITLDLEQISVGAREQIGVISRLACAAIVSPDGGGAPVVIDDALGWSDPTRLQAMGAAIAFAGRQCQVIVLTCTPGRYAHVGNAEVVRLPT